MVNPYDKTSTTTETFKTYMKPENRHTPHYEPTICVRNCDWNQIESSSILYPSKQGVTGFPLGVWSYKLMNGKLQFSAI